VTLADLVRRSAARAPEAVAVVAPDGTLRYGELDAAAERCAAGLHALGVERGDRVALWADKSARLVAAMQGALRLGAAYVPIDPQSPPLRARSLVEDCAVRAVVTTCAREKDLAGSAAALLLLDDNEANTSEGRLGWCQLESLAPAPRVDVDAGELAYVLYTSGSTGKPKGVCLSHANALAFVEWAVAALALAPSDVLSNHAPFHFDLSVLDLYAAFAAGARVCLVAEGAAYAPRRLVELCTRERVSVWYSVPSALILMMEHGCLLEAELPSLRAICFAGEPFPGRHLAPLRRRFAPPVRLLNLYGPTETNVCTAWELPLAGDAGLPAAIPIGRATCGDRVWLRSERGLPVEGAGEGELMVEGPTVMMGYFGQPPQRGAYPTGDLVRRDAAGELTYLGRRDQMVKVRGYRVEPAEVEAALLGHPDLREAAVVVTGAGLEARLVAWAALADGASRPSLLALKERCAQRLPRPMIVDEVRWLEALPRTGNGKVDRARLSEWARSEGGSKESDHESSHSHEGAPGGAPGRGHRPPA
jgi:amino acid adenylation domain-containing protein